MHREFCTLFDSNYAFKALATYRSLERRCPDFHLTAFCFDEEVEDLLGRLSLPNLSTVPLTDLEEFDPELLSVKHDRSPVEYCWTATPALPLYMFAKRADIDEVTYIDADLMFFSDPEPLFEEMGDASVLITPHRYPPQYSRLIALAGIYNVQFLTFRRDEHGIEALRWWHDRCIEWCYFRFEDGKIGDQGYLDDWPERFRGVHVLQHKGGGLAPWNMVQYDLRADGERVWVDNQELVFFHYHHLSLLAAGGYDWHPPGYDISDQQFEVAYLPYFAALEEAVTEIRAIEPGFDAGMVHEPTFGERLAKRRLALGEWVQHNLNRLALLRQSLSRR